MNTPNKNLIQKHITNQRKVKGGIPKVPNVGDKLFQLTSESS
jgi:hypothetical protein